ncbi:hypothetical protein AYO47_03190 [Planctomyces sp. SCGC AG-212-M04]|nr:hypothetical protein AYO47_03190 [Planctomyces sp. SCGC AG-212-M04]
MSIHRSLAMLSACLGLLAMAADAQAAPPSPPTFVSVADKPFDDGHSVNLEVEADPDEAVSRVVIERAFEKNGLYAAPESIDFPSMPPAAISGVNQEAVRRSLFIKADFGGLPVGKPVWFRAHVLNTAGERSPYVYTEQPVIPTQQFFDGNRFWFFVVTAFVCGSVIAFILIARSGAPMWIRKISALDAIDEAVGRATEMGKSCLFVTGVQDLNEIETIAGITVLSRVAEKAAEYDATVVVPTSRSLVMTAARETSQAAYLAAGRPDAYQEDRIYYVTDDQFGFVAHLSGYMMREKPAACFYMGQFYAESLLLGETGNTIGAIQIAGTAQPAQLPFFVAACDYTLIGEEFFAASAYLSRDPDQLGSLKGQDVGKLLVMSIIVIGVSLLTIVSLTKSGTAVHDLAKAAADYLQKHMLQSS